MEASAGAIRGAEEVGAASVPQANLHLQLAREQSEHAKALIAKGGKDEKAQAASLLTRAQADAELALALANQSEDQKAAQRAIDAVTALRAENPGN
jgi:hypothetical protein